MEDDYTLQGLQEEFKSEERVPAFFLPALHLAPPLPAPHPRSPRKMKTYSHLVFTSP